MLPSDIDEIVARLEKNGLAFTGKRILLTGSRGFLGRHFVEVFSRLKCEVIALDKGALAAHLGAGKIVHHPNVEAVDHDVTIPFPVHGRVDFILSLAGIASPRHYKAFPMETLDVCVQGNRHMLDLAHEKDASILVASSSEIYGDPDPANIPTKEEYRGFVDCRGERSAYDESKRLAETLAWIYHNKYSVDVKVVRPFNVYGPGLSQKDYRVLSKFATSIVRGERLKVFGTGSQTRTMCYVTDAIVGFCTALLKGAPGEAYNVGSPTPEISMMGLALEFEAAAHRDVEQFPIDLVPSPSQYLAEPQRRCPDIGKLKALGFSPMVQLGEGLWRFIRWASTEYTVEGDWR